MFPSAATPAPVDVVVLAGDSAMFELVRNAVDERNPVWRARSAEEATDLLVSGRCGVLVLDLGTVSVEPTSLVHQVTRQFPDVVIVVSGRQAEQSMLTSLISDGLVYRFMHKPLSRQRAGMFLDAAIRCHGERRAAAPDPAALPGEQSPPRRIPWQRLLAGAAIAALLLGLALFAFDGGAPRDPLADERAEPAAVVSELPMPRASAIEETASVRPATIPSATPPPAPAVPAAPAAPDTVLARAHRALAAGRFEAPAGDNALDLFRAVLLVRPYDADARAGLDRAAAGTLAQAQFALVAGRKDEARRLTRRVLSVEPAHAAALRILAQIDQATVPASKAPAAKLWRVRPPAAAASRRGLPPAAAVSSQDRAAVAPPMGSTPRVGRTAPTAVAGAASSTPAAVAPRKTPASVSNVYGPPISSGHETAGYVKSASADDYPLPTPARERTSPVAASDGAAPTDAGAGDGPSIAPLPALEQMSFSAPVYPKAARRAGTEGWVELEFTVTGSGHVGDVQVVAAEPEGVFDQAAIKALQRWRFKPTLVDGKPAVRSSSVVLRFNLDD